MRLEQLQYVLVIDQYRSLSQAAKALYINQSALSRTLASLEEELRVQLFIRTHQGMIPTAVGQMLMPHFQQILDEAATIETLIAHHGNDEIVGALTISAGAVLCNDILLDIITAYNQCYPLVTIDVLEEYAFDTAKHLSLGEADIGLSAVSTLHKEAFLTNLLALGLAYENLAQTPLMVLLSSQSALAAQTIVTYAQLAAYPMFMPKKAQPYSPRKGQIHYCPDRDYRNKMIIKQQGFSITSQLEMLNDPYFCQGLLIQRPLADPIGSPLSIGLVYDSKRCWQSHEAAFLQLVRQIFAQLYRDYPDRFIAKASV